MKLREKKRGIKEKKKRKVSIKNKVKGREICLVSHDETDRIKRK